ncbi:MAG TPA: hypothetical protein VGQ70_07285, partial [Candidatus Udaeobacter sp.]|nr:hypothetical protein [Candidatus Udaeobacter sp.]
MSYNPSFRKLAAILILVLAGVLISFPLGTGAGSKSQQAFPDRPEDATRVYYLSAENKLLALPFEPAATSPNVFLPAPRDKVVRLHIIGQNAATTI